VGVLTIRNVDDDVIAALKRQAEANHRSLEGELRHLLAPHAVPNTVPAVADSRTSGNDLHLARGRRRGK